MDRLLELGIKEHTAQYALDRHNGNVQRAADYALSGRVSHDEANDLLRAALDRSSTGASSLNPRPSTDSMSTTASTLHRKVPSLSVTDSDVPSSDDEQKVHPAEKRRGRSRFSLAFRSSKSKSGGAGGSGEKSEGEDEDRGRDRSRSESRTREGRSASGGRFSLSRRRSPSAEPLRESQSDVDADSDWDDLAEENAVRPKHNAFVDTDEEREEGASDEELSESELEDWSTDEELEMNTELNAQFTPIGDISGEQQQFFDEPPALLDEGPNILRSAEPNFGSMSSYTGARRQRKPSTRVDPLPLITRPAKFERDRCTVVIVHGNPEEALEQSGRKGKRYFVASDLSNESKYAVEWAIGTVLRDGDECVIGTVQETDTKLDPVEGEKLDSAARIRHQRERQTYAQLLSRQAISLLQRTKLHVTIICQAVHAKNSRHMLLDMIDYLEPTLAIVGSRGLGNLKGILLGSTSHYIVQKSSVPVMVARRRFKRPRKRGNADLTHRRRVPLAAAGIDTVAQKGEEKEGLGTEADRRTSLGDGDEDADADEDEPEKVGQVGAGERA